VEVTEMMFWYGHAGWALWQISLMWAVMITFGGLVVWAVYALITGGRKPGAGGGGGARQILDERLARGEIDTDEYQRLRDAMTKAADDRGKAADDRGKAADDRGKARAGSA
jgi:putative membrane protein